MALEFQTVIAGKETSDGVIRIASMNIMEKDEYCVEFVASETLTAGDPKWANYVKGVVNEYRQLCNPDSPISFHAVVVSTIPMCGGLASSASLEVRIPLIYVLRATNFDSGGCCDIP